MNRHVIRRGWVLAIVAALTAFIGVGVAWAYFTATDSTHAAQAAADTLPAGQTPSVSVSYPSGVATATITFNRSATSSGRTVGAFLMQRYASPTGGAASAQFTCTPGGSSSSVTCTESAVPNGTWYYSDTPAIAGSSWVGAESSRSNSITPDAVAPTVVYSQNPAANSNGYNNSTVSVTLTATDNTGGTGVASVTYKIDSGSNVTTSGSSVTFNVSGDGTHTVSYFATDNANNASAPLAQTIKIDTVKPSAPAVTSLPTYINIANQSNISIGGTAEAGATINLTLTDPGSAHTITATTTAAPDTGAWTFNGLNPSTLTDGQISVGLTATDQAGNVSTPGTQTTITKDTVAPAAPTFDALAPYINTASNSASYPVSGSREANTSVVLTVTDTGGTTHTITKTIASGASTSWSTTIDTTGLNQGTVNYSAVATDAAGNPSSAGTTSNTKDTIAPAAPTIDAVAAYINKTSDSSSYAVSGSRPPNTGVVLTVTDTGGTTHTITKTIASGASTSWSTTIDTTGLNQGTINYSAVATDAAGNPSSATTTSNTKDTVAPAAPVISVPASGSYINSSTNSSTYSVSGTKDAGTSLVLTVTDPSSAHSITKSIAQDGSTTWSTTIDSTILNQGTITYSAVATDAAGNSSSAGTTSNTKDTVAPAVPVISVPASGGYINSSTNSSSYAVSGTKDAGTSLVLTVTDPSSAHSITKSIPLDGSTTWSTTIDSTIFNQGTITYSAVATDAAGNSSAAGTTNNTKDTVAPSGLTVTCSAANSGNPVKVTCSGAAGSSAGDGTTITVAISKSGQTTVNINGTRTGSSWTTSGNDLMPKNVNGWTAAATQTDAAGNSTTVTTTFNS